MVQAPASPAEDCRALGRYVTAWYVAPSRSGQSWLETPIIVIHQHKRWDEGHRRNALGRISEPSPDPFLCPAAITALVAISPVEHARSADLGSSAWWTWIIFYDDGVPGRSHRYGNRALAVNQIHANVTRQRVTEHLLRARTLI